MSTVLLLDGSSLAFLHANKSNYKDTLKDHLKSILNRFKTDEFLIILEDSKRNFRLKAAKSKEYKGQRRTQKVKDNIDKYLPFLKNVFIEMKSYKPLTYFNVENDDVLGILSKRMNCIIGGNDRDLLAIPGVHFNLKTNKTTVVQLPGKIELIDGKINATGLYQVYSQIIKGSQKENYAGLKGYGDKSTFEVLKNLTTEDEMQNACINLFKEEHGNDWRTKLKEGFRLSWVITENDTLITPKPVKFSKLFNP